jgi:hypothetical protein
MPGTASIPTKNAAGDARSTVDGEETSVAVQDPVTGRRQRRVRATLKERS